jgi:hypothetical protein
LFLSYYTSKAFAAADQWSLPYGKAVLSVETIPSKAPAAADQWSLPYGKAVLSVETILSKAPAAADQWSLPYGKAVLSVETIIPFITDNLSAIRYFVFTLFTDDHFETCFTPSMVTQ